MPVDLANVAEMMKDQPLMDRILAATLELGIKVLDQETASTPNGPNRLAYAAGVLKDPPTQMPIIQAAVCLGEEVVAQYEAGERVSSAITDDAIRLRLSSMWDTVAGKSSSQVTEEPTPIDPAPSA